MVAGELAAAEDRYAPGALGPRLGAALAGLAQELADAHCEIALLRRENAALRATVDRGNAA